MHSRPAAGESANPVDRAQWERMLGEVGPRTLRRYAESYLELLPERLDDLERAMAADDRFEASRITADLRTSSAMLGARRLAALVTRVEAALNTARTGRKESAARSLRDEAHALARALRSALAEPIEHAVGPAGDGIGQSRCLEPPNR